MPTIINGPMSDKAAVQIGRISSTLVITSGAFTNHEVLGGLAAGMPMVVVPLFADQPDNARCLASAGLCISVSGDNLPSLRAAIMDGLENREMRRRAIVAANDFAALPTVDDALDEMVGG